MMKYIVMECHPSYAVLLDEEGRFVKAANLHYETGQTVCEPVLMREEPVKQRNRLRWARSGFAAVAACFLLLIGLNYYRSTLTAYSSIYLTINPEVQMDLNRKGAVIRLEGINEDGAALLEDYEYKGKDRLTVADDLIERAIDMGFLAEGGQVSFSIDAPDEALVQKYGEELQTEVLKHLENRYTITVEVVNHQTGETESSQKTQGAQETQSTQETPVSQDVPESITVPVAPEGGRPVAPGWPVTPSFPSTYYGQVRFLNASTNHFPVNFSIDGIIYGSGFGFGDSFRCGFLGSLCCFLHVLCCYLFCCCHFPYLPSLGWFETSHTALPSRYGCRTMLT